MSFDHAFSNLFLHVRWSWLHAQNLLGYLLCLVWTKADQSPGARQTSSFWDTFTAMHLFVILPVMKRNPIIITTLSNCPVGSSARHCSNGGLLSYLRLQTCMEIIGFGMVPIYTTDLLLLERYIITSQIGSFNTIASSLSPDIFPIIIGQFVMGMPMFLVYLSWLPISVHHILHPGPFGGPRHMGTERKPCGTNQSLQQCQWLSIWGTVLQGMKRYEMVTAGNRRTANFF